MRCVRFSQDGRYLAVGFADGAAQIHDVNEGAKQWYDHATLPYIRVLIVRHISELYADQSHEGTIYSICFSPDSDYLATAGKDGQVKVSCRFFVMFSQLAMTDLRHTAIASATTDTLNTLKLDLGYQ